MQPYVKRVAARLCVERRRNLVRWAGIEMLPVEQDEWRRVMLDWWREIDARALASKDSQSATLQLIERYRCVGSDAQAIAAVVIGEWALSTNSRQRFDALAVIEEFGLASAVPQLRELQSRLANVSGPEALFECAKVRKLLALLSQPNRQE